MLSPKGCARKFSEKALYNFSDNFSRNAVTPVSLSTGYKGPLCLRVTISQAASKTTTTKDDDDNPTY